MLHQDRDCTLVIGNNNSVQGRVINVCVATKRGFAVEIDDLALIDPFRQDGGQTVRATESGFTVRSVQVRPLAQDNAQQLEFERAVLTLKYGDAEPLDLSCDVLRAWPLQPAREGVGLALLAPTQTVPETWDKYVTSLNQTGRYNPEEPTPLRP
jgi:hypothetical protein